MADARFPDRWLMDRRVMALPAEGFRDFVTSLTWAVSNMTDGKITRADLMFVPGFNQTSIRTLVISDLWEELDDNSWQIIDFAKTQSSKAELEAYFSRKANDRDRKARQRARERAQESRDMSRDMSAESPRQGEARQGKDRQGRKRDADNVVPLHANTYVNAETGEQISQEQYDKAWPEEQEQYQPMDGSAS
ncbi:hypothetical protein [Pseudoclavibacter sp. CFCC 13611]|uniref:hypothetical protein n=1 Tax=Pseudoclavibacter sp. CFCC 13611 TaxID=2615178 RepID=UPI0013016DE4|nr:hypothetical protein [Pseudoclavibacter sp. CFCC 13611]KAB1662828.1 hypothetical protein F8O08_09700 [Pseudoclavibacter sp. CFCC 13611]